MSHNLNKIEIDQLSEMVNIGAGNASTALSHMLGKKIQMNVPSSFVGRVEEVQKNISTSEKKVLAIFLKFHGDIEGAMVMIFDEEAAIDFVEILTKNRKKDIDSFSEEDKSSLLELGNILLGASITALGKFLDISMVSSIPDLENDMMGAIMDAVLLEMGSEAEEILAFNVNLSVPEDDMGGDLYFIFDPTSSDKILKLTKAKLGQ